MSTSDSPSLAQYLHAINQEIARPTYSGGTQHSIRSVFESSLLSYPHSPLLWTQYLRWEISLIPASSLSPSANAKVSENRSKSKSKTANPSNTTKKALDVYYRGVNALPWHKCFAMLGFTMPELRKGMEFEELVGSYEGMEKRGSRIRCGIEEEIEDGKDAI